MTTKSWIVFKIDGEQVYQIEYLMHTGQDTIDDYKSMIAGEYGVPMSKVKVSVDDEELDTSSSKLKIAPQVMKKTVKAMTSRFTWN